MSTVEAREQLIQQRQAEKYVNVIRMVLLAFLTLALVFRGWGPEGWLTPGTLLLVGMAWSYAVFVHAALSWGWFRPLWPWVTTVIDLGFIASGFFLVSVTAAVSLMWTYALLFLMILFSALRERPELTLFNGLASTGLYGVFLVVSLPLGSAAGSTADQLFLMVILLLAGFFSSFHARSVRKAFERAATSDRLRRETDARLKVLALHFPGVLFQAEIQNQNFYLRYVSEGSRDLLGIDSRALIAQPNLFFAQAESGLKDRLSTRIDPSVESSPFWEVEFSYQPPTAGPVWLKMSVTSHERSLGTLVLNGLLTDVSEQRRAAEALREANQAKTDFLATMSHELRTPLNAILGNSDHLARLARFEDDKRAFRDLQTSAETLLGLIEDILVFSRFEAGRLTADIRPFSWRSHLEAAIDTYRPQAEAKGLAWTVQLPSGAPTWIWSDSLRLRQIVGNLLGNAIKFTPAGSVGVEAAFLPGDQSPWFIVKVSDTGIGIPPEARERIFEKFTQGEHGKSRTYGGLGLGLSISRSLAGLLGGSLTVESRSGQGSVFTLQIPVRTGDGAEGAVTSSNLDETQRSAHILLVEDNQTNQDVATRMLKKLGVQVDLAPGGREAVAMAQQKFYDLILMDWQMPVMDGREATARIRALPGGQDLVIVALSGHALPGDRELLLASGFDDYLSKPVRMDDFRAILAKWVKNSPNPG